MRRAINQKHQKTEHASGSISSTPYSKSMEDLKPTTGLAACGVVSHHSQRLFCNPLPLMMSTEAGLHAREWCRGFSQLIELVHTEETYEIKPTVLYTLIFSWMLEDALDILLVESPERWGTVRSRDTSQDRKPAWNPDAGLQSWHVATE